MSTIIFLLLHGGYKHDLSRTILEYLDECDIEGITRICVGNEQTKKRIEKNRNNIKIPYIPCLLIHKDNEPPKIYPGNIENISHIIEQLRNI